MLVFADVNENLDVDLHLKPVIVADYVFGSEIRSTDSVSLKNAFLFMLFYCLMLVANDLHHKNRASKYLIELN